MVRGNFFGSIFDTLYRRKTYLTSRRATSYFYFDDGEWHVLHKNLILYIIWGRKREPPKY